MSIGASTDDWKEFLDIEALIHKYAYNPDTVAIDKASLCVTEGKGLSMWDSWKEDEEDKLPTGFRWFASWCRKPETGLFCTGDNCFFSGLFTKEADLADALYQIANSEANKKYGFEVRKALLATASSAVIDVIISEYQDLYKVIDV